MVLQLQLWLILVDDQKKITTELNSYRPETFKSSKKIRKSELFLIKYTDSNLKLQV